MSGNTSTPSVSTITTGEIRYTMESLCNNADYIQKLKDAYLLPSNFSIEELECPQHDYVLGERIGSGGVNNVYVIKGGDVDKVLRISQKEMKDTDFFHEIGGYFIQTYLSGICKNICKIYDFGFLRNTEKKFVRMYAVLEKLNGDLINEVENIEERKRNKFTKDEWLSIFEDVLTALNCIHSNKYAHLDIKPDNMGYNKDGKVCLFDFDTARYFPKVDSKQSNIYVSPKLLGTPEYLSPELSDRDQYPYPIYSKYADIFALSIWLGYYESYLDNHDNINYSLCRMCEDLLTQMQKTLKITPIGQPPVPIATRDYDGYYSVMLSGRINAEEALAKIRGFKPTKNLIRHADSHSSSSSSSTTQKLPPHEKRHLDVDDQGIHPKLQRTDTNGGGKRQWKKKGTIKIPLRRHRRKTEKKMMRRKKVQK